MKKLILLALLIFSLSTPKAVSQKVYIDAGHGGAGADQTHNGGDSSGTAGENGTAEQWINLQVALAIRDSLLARGLVEEEDFKLSRLTDTTDIDLRERVREANLGGFNQFISVHHNGLTEGSIQGTEVIWCDRETFENGDQRPFEAYTDTLARKVRYELLEAFGYKDRCWVQNQADPMSAVSCLNCTKYISKQAAMANVITEASDIAHHPEEEALYTNIHSDHTEVEAGAIIAGWESYVARQGFGRVEYYYAQQSNNDGMCTTLVNFDPYVIPYERT